MKNKNGFVCFVLLTFFILANIADTTCTASFKQQSESPVSLQEESTTTIKYLFDTSFDELYISYGTDVFPEGLLPARTGDLMGYIDIMGNYIIGPKFTSAFEFENGYAVVAVGDFWGVINKEGEFVYDPVYVSIVQVFKESAIVEIDDWSYAFVDEDGNILYKVEDGAYFPSLSSELETVILVTNTNCKLLDQKGTLIAQYDMIEPFFNDAALVMDNERMGLIGTDGEFIIVPQYGPDSHRFPDGSIVFKKAGKSFYYTKNYELILETDYDICSSLENENQIGLYRTYFDENVKYGIINAKGEIVLDAEYDFLFGPVGRPGSDFFSYVTDEGAGLMDINGNNLCSGYDFLYQWDENIFLVSIEDKIGLFDADKSKLILKPRFNAIGEYSEGLAPFFVYMDENYEQGKWGFINRSGSIVIEPIFDEVYSSFKNGLIIVAVDNKFKILKNPLT